MSDKGWIKIDRKILDNWLWNDKPFSTGQAWIDLLLSANFKEGKFRLGNEIVRQEPGQIITSQQKLADRWGWSRKKVINFLTALERDGMVNSKRDNKRTVINIVKWGFYQSQGTAKEPQSNRSGTGEAQVRNTIKNIKNYKNAKEAADAALGQRQQPQLPDGCPEDQSGAWSAPAMTKLSDGYLQEVIRAWNAQKCTRNIDRIAGKRLEAVAANAEPDQKTFMDVICDLDNQKFLANREQPVTFDWFVKPENYLKVLEGNFRDLYSETVAGGEADELRIDWEALERYRSALS